MKEGAGLLAPASWFFSTAISFIINVVIILFVGLYLVLDPQRYIRGLLALVPSSRRSRVKDILDTLATTLRQWRLATPLVALATVLVNKLYVERSSE